MKLLTTYWLVIPMLTLNACGGSSNDSDNDLQPEPEPVTEIETKEHIIELGSDYSPDDAKLTADANNSSELYVDAQFNFEKSSSLALDLSAISPEGKALKYTFIRVYSVPDSVTQWLDEDYEQAQLLASGQTDGQGHFKRSLEFPVQPKQLLLVLNTMSINNKALVQIEGGTLEYLFR